MNGGPVFKDAICVMRILLLYVYYACAVTKKTAGFLGFYPLSIAKRSAKYGVGSGKSWGKPRSL